MHDVVQHVLYALLLHKTQKQVDKNVTIFSFVSYRLEVDWFCQLISRDNRLLGLVTQNKVRAV